MLKEALSLGRALDSSELDPSEEKTSISSETLELDMVLV
jgi:hypothetical protein